MHKINANKPVILLILFIAVSLISCASTAPLPQKINIASPSTDLPPVLTNLSGIWKGKWEGALDTILVVKKIDNQTASIIFSLGSSPIGILNPQNNYWYKSAKVIDNSTIGWSYSNGSKLLFKMEDDFTRIKGIFRGPTGSKKIIHMDRVKADEIPDVNIDHIPLAQLSQSNKYIEQVRLQCEKAAESLDVDRDDVNDELLIADSVEKCILDDPNLKNKQIPYPKVVFASSLTEKQKPADNIKEISIHMERVYLYIVWHNITQQKHDYSSEIYDGSGKLISFFNMSFVPSDISWDTWSWHNFSFKDRPGDWMFKVYLDGDLMVHETLNVISGGKAISAGSEKLFAMLENSKWGWTGLEPGCVNNPHEIKFSADNSKATFTFQKSIENVDGNKTKTFTYDVIKANKHRITMALIGETRKDDSGNPVVWDLVKETDDIYTWYRHDWPSDYRTPGVERCNEAN